MKRVNRRIDFNETGRYVINDVSEVYHYKYFKGQEGKFVKVTHLTSYQICNVYTNKNNTLSAYLMCNGKRASYKMVFDHKNTRLDSKKTKIVRRQLITRPDFNCHGLTFLDTLFWFELNNQDLELILHDDGYKECAFKDLKEREIALYYTSSGNIHHSAKILNGNLISKFGLNYKLTLGEDQIKRLYAKKVDFSLSRYFNI